MPTDFETILRCTLGGADFQLSDHRWEDAPILANGRQQGRRVAVRGEGWLQATSHTGLATALRNAETSFRTGGKDLIIYGPGDVELHKLLAASCVDGGPYVEFTVEPGLDDAWGARHVTFTVNGQTTPDANTGDKTDAIERTITTSSDSLRAFGWAGDLAGTDVVKAFDDLLADFQKTFALPTYVVSHEFTRNEKGDKGKFTLTATEMVDDLPAGVIGEAVDGAATFTTDRDEQMRLTRTYSYDLVVTGDVDQVLGIIRPEGLILRETVIVGKYRKRTVQATFVTLGGGNGNALMNWQASFRFEPAEQTYEERRYAGTTPILVKRPLGIGRLTFSGSATGAGIFIKPPNRPTSLRLLEPPQVTRVKLNDVEFRTDWQYAWAWEESEIELMMYMLKRPTDAPKSPLAESKPRHPPAVALPKE